MARRPSATRRDFLKQTALAAGALLTTGSARSYGRIVGANETVRVAVAGLNGRGGSHVGGLLGLPNVEIAYLVDPDTRTWGPKDKAVRERSKAEPKLVQDIRHALDDPNIDAVTIATPNHWHALMTIWACQAGKDVYVEKPCSHNVHEGRIAVEAARKFGRIVQHGTQNRSSEAKARVTAVIASGQLGKLLVSRGLCYKRRDSIGKKPATTPPSELDFNLWLGPAPMQPFHENLVHYNWHWFWDTGNGDIGNQGVHEMDLARWAIPGATLPKSVVSVGGRFGYEDQGETANTQIAAMDFGETLLIFEVRGRPTLKFLDQGVGNVYHLEAGTIAGTTFFPKDSDKPAPLPPVDVTMGPGGGDHFANFIAAVRSRKTGDLNADILEGHYSSALCHLANVSYRLGEPQPFDPAPPALAPGAAGDTFERMKKHLVDDVGINLRESKLQVGKVLEIDAERETIRNDAAAVTMLTRNYRAPFVVPDKLV